MGVEDDAVDWSDVDTSAVRRLLAEAYEEGGEYTLDEVARRLDAAIEAACRMRKPPSTP
jgi:hypothetical protein